MDLERARLAVCATRLGWTSTLRIHPIHFLDVLFVFGLTVPIRFLDTQLQPRHGRRAVRTDVAPLGRRRRSGDVGRLLHKGDAEVRGGGVEVEDGGRGVGEVVMAGQERCRREEELTAGRRHRHGESRGRKEGEHVRIDGC